MKKAAIVFVLTIITLPFISGCMDGNSTTMTNSAKIIDKEKIIDTIYSGLPTAINDDGFLPKSKSELYIENIFPGSFTGIHKDELLIVVRIPSKNIPHVAGLYHAYMAVFDNRKGVLEGKIMHFRQDEGDYTVYRGTNQDYLFFTGAVVYQGVAVRDGGLYKISNNTWEKVWPEDSLFWETNAVDIRNKGLRVLKRRIISAGEQTVPDITWDFDYYLYWSDEVSSFIKMDTEY